MSALQYGLRLLVNDSRLVFRDPLLGLLSLLAIMIGAGARFALPALDAGLEAAGLMPKAPGGLRFSDTYPLWVTFIGLWQAAVMPGTIFGFLLLDEKEDRTLVAMRVTPLPFEGYLGYRVVLPALLAFALALVLLPLMGFAPVPLGPRVLLCAGASLAAPIITLLLAVSANDKVQGFAYTKFVGVAGLIILAGWFVAPPAQWALGLFPPFLVSKAYWMLLQGQPVGYGALALGVLMQAGLLWGLIRGFERRLPTD